MPERLKGQMIDLKARVGGRTGKAVRAYSPWTDQWTELKLKEGTLTLPPFQRSIVVKIQ